MVGDRLPVNRMHCHCRLIVIEIWPKWPKSRYQNNAEFYVDFEAAEKTAKNLLTKILLAKKCAKLEFVLFYTTNLQKFLENNFF